MLCLLFSSWRRKKRLFDKRPNEKSKMSPQAKHKTLVAQRRKILFFFEEVWGQIFLLVLVSTENRGESTVHFLYRCHFRLILLIRYCFNKKTFSHSTRGEILLRIVFCLSVVKKQTHKQHLQNNQNILNWWGANVTLRSKLRKSRITSKINAIEWIVEQQ